MNEKLNLGHFYVLESKKNKENQFKINLEVIKKEFLVTLLSKMSEKQTEINTKSENSHIYSALLLEFSDIC